MFENHRSVQFDKITTFQFYDLLLNIPITLTFDLKMNEAGKTHQGASTYTV
jgi:hypothetical protein